MSLAAQHAMVAHNGNDTASDLAASSTTSKGTVVKTEEEARKTPDKSINGESTEAARSTAAPVAADTTARREDAPSLPPIATAIVSPNSPALLKEAPNMIVVNPEAASGTAPPTPTNGAVAASSSAGAGAGNSGAGGSTNSGAASSASTGTTTKLKPSQTAFIHKLYSMLEDASIGHLISWTPTGDSFALIPNEEFSKALSQYFKHTNVSSFVRQLNMYGFHKVNDTFHCTSNEEKQHVQHLQSTNGEPVVQWEFRHGQSSFKRGDVESLRGIKRRASRQSTAHRDNVSLKSVSLSMPTTPPPGDPLVHGGVSQAGASVVYHHHADSPGAQPQAVPLPQSLSQVPSQVPSQAQVQAPAMAGVGSSANSAPPPPPAASQHPPGPYGFDSRITALEAYLWHLQNANANVMARNNALLDALRRTHHDLVAVTDYIAKSRAPYNSETPADPELDHMRAEIQQNLTLLTQLDYPPPRNRQTTPRERATSILYDPLAKVPQNSTAYPVSPHQGHQGEDNKPMLRARNVSTPTSPTPPSQQPADHYFAPHHASGSYFFQQQPGFYESQSTAPSSPQMPPMKVGRAGSYPLATSIASKPPEYSSRPAPGSLWSDTSNFRRHTSGEVLLNKSPFQPAAQHGLPKQQSRVSQPTLSVPLYPPSHTQPSGLQQHVFSHTQQPQGPALLPSQSRHSSSASSASSTSGPPPGAASAAAAAASSGKVSSPHKAAGIANISSIVGSASPATPKAPLPARTVSTTSVHSLLNPNDERPATKKIRAEP